MEDRIRGAGECQGGGIETNSKVLTTTPINLVIKLPGAILIMNPGRVEEGGGGGGVG